MQGVGLGLGNAEGGFLAADAHPGQQYGTGTAADDGGDGDPGTGLKSCDACRREGRWAAGHVPAGSAGCVRHEGGGRRRRRPDRGPRLRRDQASDVHPGPTWQCRECALKFPMECSAERGRHARPVTRRDVRTEQPVEPDHVGRVHRGDALPARSLRPISCSSTGSTAARPTRRTRAGSRSPASISILRTQPILVPEAAASALGKPNFSLLNVALPQEAGARRRDGPRRHRRARQRRAHRRVHRRHDPGQGLRAQPRRRGWRPRSPTATTAATACPSTTARSSWSRRINPARQTTPVLLQRRYATATAASTRPRLP